MDEVTTVSLDINAAPAPVSVVPPTPVIEAFSGKRGDFEKDMALLKAQLEPTPEAPAPIAAQIQPEITAPPTAPVTVPEKFKDAEGNLDVAKLEKSTLEVEAAKQAALTKYLALEKSLRQTQNQTAGLQKQSPVVIAPTEAPAPATPFAAQLEADMAKFGAGAVLERLFEAAKETAKNEMLGEVKADREERLEIKSRKELSDIASFDPGVLTPEGLESLARIRAERPWMEKAHNPTSEAYKVYLAEQVLKARQAGTVLPNPTASTARPPATPVSAAPRVVVQAAGPDLSTRESTDKYIASLSKEEQARFFKSQGLRW